eukprot:c10618_g1_i2.p1 GENE.c10618_g1_i2~~c10618_g1_i2.p1  ORF type:complete len:140 (+),score=31.97 c10618_g1_i2:23-442(+)
MHALVLLRAACTQGDADGIKDILSHHPELTNSKLNETFVTPLMLTAAAGSVSGMTELRLRGAQVNDQDKDGWTALMFAAVNSQPKCVSLLLEDGASVSAQTSAGWTALMYSAVYGHSDCVSRLAQHNLTNLDAVNNVGI